MEPEIMTRSKAQQLGLKHYYTGEPCVRGHIDRRFTSIGKCMACARENAAANYTPLTDKKRAYNNQESFVVAATEQHKGKYSYDETVYVNAHNKVIITCPIHGQFSMSPTNHIQGKGCAFCGNIRMGEAQRKQQEDFLIDAIKMHGETFDYSETVYTHAKAKIALRCKEHPDVLLYQQASNHLQGQSPCQRCGHATSKAEQEIAEFLSQFATVVNPEKTILAPYHIDIWLPEFNMGVEYHGLFHHLTSKRGKLHRQKWEMAQKANIRLVQIFEDEWRNKQEIVKNKIRHILNVISNTEKWIG
jgi:ribosomal protein L37AE/L43A